MGLDTHLVATCYAGLSRRGGASSSPREPGKGGFWTSPGALHGCKLRATVPKQGGLSGWVSARGARACVSPLPQLQAALQRVSEGPRPPGSALVQRLVGAGLDRVLGSRTVLHKGGDSPGGGAVPVVTAHRDSL